MPSVRWIAMALASWEPDLETEPDGAAAGRMRCLVDLGAPCNMACAHCGRSTGGRRLGQDQALGLVQALAAEVIASGARSAVAVFYGGEPLLARDQLLAQARALREPLRKAGVGCELGLVTNGTRLDPGTVLHLARAGFTRVSVTIAGAREQHELRRKVPGAPSYRHILDNLRVARELLSVVVRYELHDDMDLVRLPEFIADLRLRGLVGGDRPIKLVAQPHRSYARQARDLFAPHRLPVEGGSARRGDADP
jgi:uncharacterized protein